MTTSIPATMKQTSTSTLSVSSDQNVACQASASSSGVNQGSFNQVLNNAVENTVSVSTEVSTDKTALVASETAASSAPVTSAVNSTACPSGSSTKSQTQTEKESTDDSTSEDAATLLNQSILATLLIQLPQTPTMVPAGGTTTNSGSLQSDTATTANAVSLSLSRAVLPIVALPATTASQETSQSSTVSEKETTASALSANTVLPITVQIEKTVSFPIDTYSASSNSQTINTTSNASATASRCISGAAAEAYGLPLKNVKEGNATKAAAVTSTTSVTVSSLSTSSGGDTVSSYPAASAADTTPEVPAVAKATPVLTETVIPVTEKSVTDSQPALATTVATATTANTANTKNKSNSTVAVNTTDTTDTTGNIANTTVAAISASRKQTGESGQELSDSAAQGQGTDTLSIPDIPLESQNRSASTDFPQSLSQSISSSQSATPLWSDTVITTQSAGNASETAYTNNTDTHNIMDQIVERARLIQSTDQSEMVIQLKPEHLGELTLKIHISGGIVNATFHSGSADVRGLLETSLPQLKSDLASQGIKVDNVSIHAGLDQYTPNQSQGQWSQQAHQQKNYNWYTEKAIDDEDSIPEIPSIAGVDSTASPASGIDYLA
ncbi:MAG TPA: flagellar hook-length control protein FliK [Patescibacteria group bacterium]|nr:flagellar hook-length control protein FliK [Patescibacteria group bacterium]